MNWARHMQTGEQRLSAIQSTPSEVAGRMLAEVGALAPTIAARAGEAEAAARIPADILQLLKSVGVFRMTVPKTHGGMELDYPAVARVLQAISRIDGSIGWVCTLASGGTLFLPLLAGETCEKMYRDGPDLFCAGSSQPGGTAEQEDGGWRVNGRWPFASGCQDADWIAALCVLTQRGKPVPGPAEGVPAMRLVCLPARCWQIEQTWQASGLRATGSHHIVLRDAVASPENLMDMASTRPCEGGPLYSAPGHFAALAHGPVTLGLAEGALDDLMTMARSGRKQSRASAAMRDSEIFHYELGRVQAEFRAAQGLFEAQAASHWRHAVAGTLNGEALLAEGTQAAIWITEACVRVVQRCFALAGGAAVYESCPLQRRLRDIEVAAQHAAVQQRHYAKAGKLLLSSASDGLEAASRRPSARSQAAT
jgi:alkylation response protein AidB-like acyl-CoA dehydrogenase